MISCKYKYIKYFLEEKFMNKSEFIKTVADEAGVSQGVTAKVIDAAISAVM